MIVSKLLTREMRRRYDRDCEVLYFSWVHGGSFNVLTILDPEDLDVSDYADLDSFLGTDIEEVQGFVHLSVRCYDPLGGFDDVEVLVSDNLIYWDSDNGGDKCGKIAAAHFHML